MYFINLREVVCFKIMVKGIVGTVDEITDYELYIRYL